MHPRRRAGALFGRQLSDFTPSPDAVQETKVENGIFDAQFGHGNGVVTNVVVKNGTNSLHGAAYYAFQNTYLDANYYQNVANHLARPNNQVNQTGLVLDGPVVLPKLYNGRDKVFFMFSAERYATHTPQTFSTRVATAAELTGDFSGLCPNGFNSSGFCASTGGVQLFVPNSPVDANSNRTEFFLNNNIVASTFGTAGYTCTGSGPTCTVTSFGAPVAGTSALNATGAALAAYIPARTSRGPRLPVRPPSPTTSLRRPPIRVSYPSFIGRFDFALGQLDKLSVIGFRSGLTQSFPLEGFSKGIGPNGYGYSVYRNTRGGSMDETHQFSSSLVLDSRFGLTEHPFGLIYPGAQGFSLTSVSINTTGLPYNSFPGESSSDGYSSLAPGAGGQISNSVLSSLDETVAKQWGRHSLRAGFQGDLLRYNVQNPMSGFGNGSGTPGFNFDRRFTQSNSVLYGAGSAPVSSGAGSGDSLASCCWAASPRPTTTSPSLTPRSKSTWRLISRMTGA